MNGDIEACGVVTCSECHCIVPIPDETTPLMGRRRENLRPRPNVNYCILFLLLFVLVLGVTIGIYLIVKDYEWEDDEPFPLFTNTLIYNQTEGSDILESDICKIKLIQIPGSACSDNQQCIKQFSDSKNAIEINFLIDSSGASYQYLDYDSHCINCDNNTLIIAISSTNSNNESSRLQTYKIVEIIDTGAKHNKFSPCCEISTSGQEQEVKKFANVTQNVINRKYKCIN